MACEVRRKALNTWMLLQQWTVNLLANLSASLLHKAIWFEFVLFLLDFSWIFSLPKLDILNCKLLNSRSGITYSQGLERRDVPSVPYHRKQMILRAFCRTLTGCLCSTERPAGTLRLCSVLPLSTVAAMLRAGKALSNFPEHSPAVSRVTTPPYSCSVSWLAILH